MSGAHGTTAALGIDIGGTGVKVAARAGDRWKLGVSDRYAKPDRATLLAAIRQSIGRAELDAPVDRVGLCVPGIASDDGTRIDIAVNVPGLVGWAFADLAGDALGRPAEVVRTNDAAAATTDWVRTHGETGRVAGIVIGTGVGLSVVEAGSAVAWTDGAAGHLGQVDVTVGDPASAPIGPDGGRGGLEAYVGARAVAGAGGLDRAFADGSPALLALARAARVCHAIYRPDVIVLLGGIGIRLAGNEDLDREIRRDLTSIARPGWRLAFGSDDFHAARGAAQLFGI